MSINFNLETNFDNPEIKVTYSHRHISMCPIDSNFDFDLYQYGNVSEYRNIWDGVDLFYYKNDGYVKEVICVENINSKHEFKFQIDTNLDYKIINKNYVLVDRISNRPYFRFDELIAFDKDNKIIDSDKLKINIDKKLGILTVFLEKLNEDAYPIKIDPSIVVIPSGSNPSRGLDKSNQIDLDIIHRKDESGTYYHEQEQGREFNGDKVSFSRKVDLRLNLEGPLKKTGALSNTQNFGIDNIQDEVSGVKYVVQDPLNYASSEPLVGKETDIVGKLTSSQTSLSNKKENKTEISFTLPLSEELGKYGIPVENATLDWSIYAIDLYVKKLIFNNEQILNNSYVDKVYGSANFNGSNSSIIYTINKKLNFTYMAMFNVDIYEGEKIPKNYRTTLTTFVKVFGDSDSGIPVSVVFYLDPDYINISEENKNNFFKIETSIPKRSIPYIGSNVFEWEMKRFVDGKTETIISSNQHGERTSFGTITRSSDSKSIIFSPPSDINVFKDSIFIEAYTNFFDPYLYEERKIFSTCVISSSIFKIVPSFLRPTICDKEDITFRVHNLGVRPINNTQSIQEIPNIISNDLNWLLYVDEILDDDNADIFESWKVLDPDASGVEILDTHTNDNISILNLYKKYGGVVNHFHIDKTLESIGYTLGNRNDVINVIESGDFLPERVLVTYNYVDENGLNNQLLSIIQPTNVAPENCSDQEFSISIEPHCIVSSDNTESPLDITFSKDISEQFNTKPEDFIIDWLVERVNPRTKERTEIDSSKVIIPTDNIKSVRIKHPSSEILSTTNEILIITATLIYLPTNKSASDNAFILKNRKGILIPCCLTVPLSSGRRFDVDFSTDVNDKIDVISDSLTYNHISDYSNPTPGLRIVKLEILNPLDGTVATDIDNVLSGGGDPQIESYGSAFIDYQYPAFDTTTNRLVQQPSYNLNNKGITYKSPSHRPDRNFVVLRIGFNDSTSGQFEYAYMCIEFVDQLYTTYYPDILKSEINGVSVKEFNGSDKNEFIKEFLMEPDRAYEFRISNDIFDDGKKDLVIPLKNYEIKVWYIGDNNLTKILESHKYLINPDDQSITQESKNGILQEFGITSMPDRCYVDNDIQYWNFQAPPNLNPYSSTTYYSDLYGSDGKLKTPIYISVWGERDDKYETIIETARYVFKKIPVESSEYAIYKNPKNGFVEFPEGEEKSIWIIDPFQASLIDLSRTYDPETEYYIYVLSTNYEIINNNESNYFNFFIDNTPDDSFDSNYKLSGKSFYELEISYTATDTGASGVANTGAQWNGKFALRGDSSLDSEIGRASIFGGVNFEGSLKEFFTLFNSTFETTYAGLNTRLNDRLLNFLLQKTQVDDNEFSNNSTNPQDNVSLQLLIYKWKSPSLNSDGSKKELTLTALSGKSPYNVSENNENGIQKQAYFESSPLKLGAGDLRPLPDDEISEGSMYVNPWNGDIYVGLEGNGMKYIISNNLKVYEVPDTTSFGIDYNADLEENILDRFNFPEYRHLDDNIINYDFTGLRGDGRIDPEGIDFPSTITCFYLWFDHVNIKYMLFFGTENDGLWCFDDIDIYGKDRTLKLGGLAKRIFLPSSRYPTIDNLSDTITDIQIGFPTLDLCFTTVDTMYLLKAEDISSATLFPDQYFDGGGKTQQDLLQFKVLPKISINYISAGCQLFSDWLEDSGNDVKRIIGIKAVTKPISQDDETEHSGRITISPNSLIASGFGFIITVVTNSYTSVAHGSLGDVIYHIQLLMGIDDPARPVKVVTGVPNTNTVASTGGHTEVLDSENNLIYIPKPKQNAESIRSGPIAYKLSIADIDSFIEMGTNFINEPACGAIVKISSMHRQDVLDSWGDANLDEYQYRHIIPEIGSDGVDPNGISYSDIHEDIKDKGKPFLNPLQAFIPKNTRPLQTPAQAMAGTLIGSAGNHIAENEQYIFNATEYENFVLLNQFIPSTNPNTSDDGDIYWRIYYNLMIKDSTESVYDTGSYAGFHYIDDPGSEFTLVQIPRVATPDGKSLWLYKNETLDLVGIPAIKELVRNLNLDILENDRILYYRDLYSMLSYKLNTSFPITVIDGEFLLNELKNVGGGLGSTDGQLYYVGSDSDLTQTAEEINAYLESSGRDFILIKHSPKKEIFNVSGLTENFTNQERRTYWNGNKSNPLSFGMKPSYIVEQVPLHGTSDTTDFTRSSFIGGQTYYEDEVFSSGENRMFVEQTSDGWQDRGMYIPAGVGETSPEISLDNMGTVIYAQNNDDYYLNPMGGNGPLYFYNSFSFLGHNVINYQDRDTFQGEDPSGSNIFDIDDTYALPDKYLYPQTLDYMKITQYYASKRQINTDNPLNPYRMYNFETLGSQRADIHGFWGHVYHEDQLSSVIDKLDSYSGTRRERLVDLRNDIISVSGTYWRPNSQWWISSFNPDWAYDGFWVVGDFGYKKDSNYTNEAFPLVFKPTMPTVLAGDTKIRVEEELYPNNVSSFSNKQWFITHFSYSPSGNELFYSVKKKDLDVTGYWKNKIHVLFIGNENVCGDDLIPQKIYDFEEMFPYDSDNIDEIKNIEEYGKIQSINYTDAVYAGIDLDQTDTFNISGTFTIASGNSLPSSATINFSGSGAPSSAKPNSTTGSWFGSGFPISDVVTYVAKPYLNGYAIKNSDNNDVSGGVSFTSSNYKNKNFNFVATQTGTPTNKYSLHGNVKLYDINGEMIATAPGVKITLSTDNGEHWYSPTGVGFTTYTGEFDLLTLTSGRTYLVKGSKPGFEDSIPVEITGPDSKVTLKLNKIPTAEELSTTFDGVISVDISHVPDPFHQTTNVLGSPVEVFGILDVIPSVKVAASIDGVFFGEETLYGAPWEYGETISKVTRTINLKDLPKDKILTVKIEPVSGNTKISAPTTKQLTTDIRNINFIAQGGIWRSSSSPKPPTTTTPVPVATYNGSVIITFQSLPNRSTEQETIIPPKATLTIKEPNKTERTVVLTGSSLSGEQSIVTESITNIPIDQYAIILASPDDNTEMAIGGRRGTITKNNLSIEFKASGGKYIDKIDLPVSIEDEPMVYDATISVDFKSIRNRSNGSEAISPPSAILKVYDLNNEKSYNQDSPLGAISLPIDYNNPIQTETLFGSTQSGELIRKSFTINKILLEETKIILIEEGYNTNISNSVKHRYITKDSPLGLFLVNGGVYLSQIVEQPPLIENKETTYTGKINISYESIPNPDGNPLFGQVPISPASFTIRMDKSTGETTFQTFNGPSRSGSKGSNTIQIPNISTKDGISVQISTNNSYSTIINSGGSGIITNLNPYIQLEVYGGEYLENINNNMLPGKASNGIVAFNPIDNSSLINIIFSWIPGSNTHTSEIFVDNISIERFRENSVKSYINHDFFKDGLEHTWRVDSLTINSTRTTGDTWTFTMPSSKATNGKVEFLDLNVANNQVRTKFTWTNNSGIQTSSLYIDGNLRGQILNKGESLEILLGKDNQSHIWRVDSTSENNNIITGDNWVFTIPE